MGYNHIAAESLLIHLRQHLSINILVYFEKFWFVLQQKNHDLIFQKFGIKQSLIIIKKR